jgi:acetyltransferase
MTIRNLDALLAPKSVALIGATPRPLSVGGTIARNLMAGGFEGPLHLVNPHHAEIDGKPCLRRIADLPVAPDLAVVSTPPHTIPGIVGELSAKGCRAVLVISAGLDADLKQSMLDAGRQNIVRILGPNSLGLMLPPRKLNATFAHRGALEGDLAFLSQSGALVTAVVDWAGARGIGFSHVVSLGDMADVDFGDLLDYLAADIHSRAILLYMEAVTHAPKFLSAARRAARSKPVIVIKSGRNPVAARAAMSHTGRLAGSDKAYEAAFQRAGILRVGTLSELFEAAEILSRVPRFTGERLMILTNGGGAGVLAADQLASQGGVMAELGEETRARLDAFLPPAWSKANPVDVIGDASPERFARALETVLSDKGCDAVLALHCPTALASSTETAKLTVSTLRKVRSGKPLITSWLGDSASAEARTLFAREKVPTFEGPAAAVRGFMQLVRYARAQDELLRTPPAMAPGAPPDTVRVDGIIQSALAAGRTALSEAEGKEILSAYGIPVAQTVTAADPAEAAALAAGMLGEHRSVVLKILSDDIVHKSDVGGVHLDLSTPASVEAAAQRMLARVGEVQPQARIKGFTLSPMITRPDAFELIAGMSVDSTFGPLILFGAGGVSVEAVADTALALPPLDLALARDLVSNTRVARLLAGYRNRKGADVGAIAKALVRLSGIVCRHPEIREIDINPLLADDSGVIALDARVLIAQQDKTPRTPLVIKPYPLEWEKRAILQDGEAVLLRPIKPEDERLYEGFLAHVTQEDLRLRLFAPQRQFSHKFLARMTQIDYAREIAFVAIRESTGELLGVSRYSADPDYEKAEYAVLARSDLKGRGLGWLLMRQLITYGQAAGLKELFGSVLAENTTMLSMCRNLGFHVAMDPEDSSIRHVTLAIGGLTLSPQ